MALDDLNPDDNGYEPSDVHEGADELPRKNFDIDIELTLDVVSVENKHQARFPSDGILDSCIKEMNDQWGEEPLTYHWVDKDELWAWHSDTEVSRRQPEFRSINILVKANSKYYMTEEGEPSHWLREISNQMNVSTVKRIAETADEILNWHGLGIHGARVEDFVITDFIQVNAIPQDSVPVWQEFLMERDQWMKDKVLRG